MTTKQKPTHTPGPWEIDSPTPNIRIGQHYYMQYRGFITDPFGKDIAEAHANARLIAAAPDLLESLKECMEIFGKLYSDGNSQAYSKAFKAIAKAE